MAGAVGHDCVIKTPASLPPCPTTIAADSAYSSGVSSPSQSPTRDVHAGRPRDGLLPHESPWVGYSSCLTVPMVGRGENWPGSGNQQVSKTSGVVRRRPGTIRHQEGVRMQSVPRTSPLQGRSTKRHQRVEGGGEKRGGVKGRQAGAHRW